MHYLQIALFIYWTNAPHHEKTCFMSYVNNKGADQPAHPRSLPAPIALLVECPLRRTGGHGFDPGPRHTKVVKNGTSCSSIGTQTYEVELGLVDPVSG